MATSVKTGLSVARASIIATNAKEASAILVKKDLEITIGEEMSRELSIIFLMPNLLFLCTVIY